MLRLEAWFASGVFCGVRGARRPIRSWPLPVLPPLLPRIWGFLGARDGLVADEDRLRRLAESSPSIVTPLNSAIGYEEAAAVAKEALKGRKTIRQTVIDRGLIGEKLSEEEMDRRLDVLAMAKVRDEG
jgi:hypothetical protein